MMQNSQKHYSSFIAVSLLLFPLLLGLSACSEPSQSDGSLSTNDDDAKYNQVTVAARQLSIALHRCIGCGRCVDYDSKHFVLSSRTAQVISQDNLDSTDLTRAIALCPMNAISLS